MRSATRFLIGFWLLWFGMLGAGVVTAHATTPDDQFMNAVTALGITGDRAQLIGEGHAACDNYGTPANVGQAMSLLGQGMDRTQASGLILAGLRAYCPEKIAGR